MVLFSEKMCVSESAITGLWCFASAIPGGVPLSQALWPYR